ncbi:MAG: cytochrome c oxidase subunit 2 [Schlesneria sp.]|nr:cytochrome c oxidase subunit 2 [Schlesneria sp.]
MTPDFRLFPESASTFADRVDHLYAFLVIVAVFFTALIASLIIYFSIKYRRRVHHEHVQITGNYWLEATWAIIPLMLTMVMFVWGAKIFLEMRSMPANPLNIRVVGKQWMWKIQHPLGRAEINELHVPMDQPVQLNMISQDVIHSFYIPAFRVKQDVLPGYYSSLWFQATKPGRYHLFCAEYCGTNHSQMLGTVVVTTPEEYSSWLANTSGESSEVAGARLFERFRCDNCHKTDGLGDGPSLTGLVGSRVPLAGGGAVIANDQYLRDSILNPAKQVVASYEPIMPSYQGQLNEADVQQLIAYIETLKPGNAPRPESAAPSE